MEAGRVEDKYPDKHSDSEADQDLPQKWAKGEAEGGATNANDRYTGMKVSGGSRSDSFWTTLGKTIVRTGVPLATKVLTDALKSRTRRGG